MSLELKRHMLELYIKFKRLHHDVGIFFTQKFQFFYEVVAVDSPRTFIFRCFQLYRLDQPDLFSDVVVESQ